MRFSATIALLAVSALAMAEAKALVNSYGGVKVCKCHKKCKGPGPIPPVVPPVVDGPAGPAGPGDLDIDALRQLYDTGKGDYFEEPEEVVVDGPFAGYWNDYKKGPTIGCSTKDVVFKVLDGKPVDDISFPLLDCGTYCAVKCA